MCSSPDIPDPPPPADPKQVQAPKAPDSQMRKKRSGNATPMGQAQSPVLLSGPGGVPNSSLSVGTSTLLGGGTAK